MRSRWTYAGLGILATLVGMGVGHLVAAFVNPAASPVLAVGSAVVDLTPTPVKNWAIGVFGTYDKPVLIGSVIVVTVLLAALAGLLARRRFELGALVLLLLVALAGAAAVLRSGAGRLDVVPAVVTAFAGVGTLRLLTSRAGETAPRTAPGDAPSRGREPTTSRRGLLLAAAVAAAVAAVTGGVGRLVSGLRTDPADVTLPSPTDPAPPFPQGLEQKVEGISSFRTPRSTFYRIDTRLTLPTVGIEDYELVIDGDVENRLSFGFEELLDLPLIERDITLTCVSNDVGGPYVGGARWLGVRLTDLLDRAKVGRTADQILSTDVDGMTISTPLGVATDGRDAMLALGMNGAALPREHGFPVRMVVPGLYGFVSACKWLTRMTLTTYDAQQAYWTERDWATDAPIKISSRIDTPQSFAEIPAGDTFVGGVAWAQHRGVGKVEVRVDGGRWQQAKLGPSAGVDYWRQWYLPWTAEKGEHTLAVRATTREGEVQTPAKAMPFPDGSSGYQEIIVRVQ